MKTPRISVILPCYNEEKNVTIVAEKLVEVLKKLGTYEIIFANDGSKDNTLLELKKLHDKNNNINFISFSRNFGHQNALRAGYKFAKGDCVICMDADLQHPAELIPELVKKWEEGYDVVYTIRKDTQDISFFKKFTANGFYFLINKLSKINISTGAADFRLIDRCVVDVLNLYEEPYIFYRGLISSIGFNQTAIEYTPQKRLYGQTKYTFKKMLTFAINGITSFSVVPLHFSVYIGFLTAGISFLYGIYAIFVRLFTNNTIEGWTSVLVGVFFLGGIQLVMIGILGEYLGKLFVESKKRPNYIIKERSI